MISVKANDKIELVQRTINTNVLVDINSNTNAVTLFFTLFFFSTILCQET